MLKLYNRNLPQEWIPEEVRKANRQKGEEAYVEALFGKSVLANEQKFYRFVDQTKSKTKSPN